MPTVVITGSAGLIGSEAVRFYAERGFDVVGFDNDMRSVFFGSSASTRWNRDRMREAYGKKYRHCDVDIRDRERVENIFREYNRDVVLVIHTAAQPSHDWAAHDPHTDFTVNANGTLVLLEAARQSCPQAVFIFTSTNKVYGDAPNRLPLREMNTRFEIELGHPYESGIDESMSIDLSMHSLFGASKLAADLLVQEYGRYFGMKTVCFRAGCLTGPAHSGAELHGFLAYLMQCAITGTPYTIFGYKGKQVRDNIHSRDLVAAFDEFYRAPRCAEVYNIGGSRHCNCSILEAIQLCEEIARKKMKHSYTGQNRAGDHIWYISDVSKFKNHYPHWQYTYDLRAILQEIYSAQVERFRRPSPQTAAPGPLIPGSVKLPK
jgi:CDP-paratose 2-epimerase